MIWITSPGYRASTNFFFNENTAVIIPLVYFLKDGMDERITRSNRG